MAQKILTNDFSGGVITPRLYGRSDLKQYYKTVADACNFIVTPQGTLLKRPGLQYKCSLDADCRIIPYTYDPEQGGAIQITNSGSGLGFTLIKPFGGAGHGASVTSTNTGGDKQSAQYKQIGDEMWITSSIGYDTVVVNNFSSLSIRSFSAESADPVPTARRLATYGLEETQTIDEVGGWVGISAKGYPAGHKPDNPDQNLYYRVYLFRGAQRSDYIQVKRTWKKAWFGEGKSMAIRVQVRLTDDFDRFVVTRSVDNEHSPQIIQEVAKEQVPSSGYFDFVDANIEPSGILGPVQSIVGKVFEAPQCADCFQQRRVFANGKSDGKALPMTLWFSEVGDIKNFFVTYPATDDSPFSPTISATGPSFIRWLCVFQEVMFLLTDGGVYSVGFSSNGGFSASTCRISNLSKITCSRTVAPVISEAGVVFVGSDNATVYTISIQDNSMAVINRTILAEHLTRGEVITSIALQEYPFSVVWVVTDSGKLLSFTFEANEGVYAWSRHELGGGIVVKEVISAGSSRKLNDHLGTWTDVMFRCQSATGTGLYTFRGDGYLDGNASYEAKARVMIPESTNAPMSFFRRNVKDVMIKLCESGNIAIVGEDGTLCTSHEVETPSSRNVRIMPRGLITEDGQFTVVSSDDRPCEILQIQSILEVE